MRKPTQREALLKAIHKALEKAEKSALAEAAEVLVKSGAFDDERNVLLLAMSDAGIASIALSAEQLCLKTERDAKRAIQLEGVATRNALDLTADPVSCASATGHAPKDGERAEHHDNG